MEIHAVSQQHRVVEGEDAGKNSTWLSICPDHFGGGGRLVKDLVFNKLYSPIRKKSYSITLDS